MLRTVLLLFIALSFCTVQAQHYSAVSANSTWQHEQKGQVKHWKAIHNKTLIHEKIFNQKGELIFDSKPKPTQVSPSFKLFYIQDLVKELEQTCSIQQQAAMQYSTFNQLGQQTSYTLKTVSTNGLLKDSVRSSETLNCQFNQLGKLVLARYLKVEPKAYSPSAPQAEKDFTIYYDSTEYVLQVLYNAANQIRAYFYFEPDLYNTVKLEFQYAPTGKLVRLENYDYYSATCLSNYNYATVRTSLNPAAEQFNCLNFWGEYPSLAYDFIYNEVGQLVRKNQVGKYGEITFHWEFSYANSGYLESENQHLTPYNALVRTFTFDTIGNAVEQTEYNRFKNSKTTTTFQIEYFE